MRLEQKQELRLVLAPILIQRLDLLQLPELELLQLLKQKLEENPFLEKDEEEMEFPLPEEIDDWGAYPQSFEHNSAKEQNFPIPLQKPNLKEFLLFQLRTTIIEPNLVKIGEHIIYELNEDGYLPVSISIEKIAEIFDEDPKIVELLLKEIQKFEPVGVGARNLQECLLIQLEANPKTPKIAISIVKNFFKDFIAQNYEKIKSKLKGSDLEKAIQWVKSCRPKPGKVWEGNVRYVLPDILIEYQEEEWIASLTDGWIPKVRISEPYREMLHNLSSLDTEEKAYLRKKWQEARLLLEGIEKRRETLTAIADYIVKNELDFLNHKNNSLKFLTMQEVAQAINRNTSTISRAIKEKWVQTPRGAFKLKSFFSGGKIKNYPEIVHRIKELIAHEDKAHPLRDQKISEILVKEGSQIARTTVIKYRTQLGIPTASKRRIGK